MIKVTEMKLFCQPFQSDAVLPAASVIHHNDLERNPGRQNRLIPDRSNTGLQYIRVILGRDYCGNQRTAASGAARRTLTILRFLAHVQ